MGGRHEVALWAGVAAFFGSLLAIGTFDILNPDQLAEYLGAVVVAAITAGGVYAKQRLDDARREDTRRCPRCASEETSYAREHREHEGESEFVSDEEAARFRAEQARRRGRDER